MSEHTAYEELAVGYAFSALEPADELQFRQHLLGCALCERALTTHFETLSHLAYAAPDAAPPPSVLEGIRAGVVASGRSGGSFVAEPAPVSSLEQARLRRTGRRTLVKRTAAVTGVAAGIAMVASLITSNVALQRRGHEEAANSSRLASAVRSIAAGTVDRVVLRAPGHQVQAMALMKGDTVDLVVDGLPRNDRRDSTYVLWERSRLGSVQAIGTFDVKSSGPVIVQGLHLDHGTTALASLVVTREHGRTAPTRTVQPALLAGELPPDRA